MPDSPKYDITFGDLRIVKSVDRIDVSWRGEAVALGVKPLERVHLTFRQAKNDLNLVYLGGFFILATDKEIEPEEIPLEIEDLGQ